MRFTSLEAWLSWQETCHPKEIDLGLERIRKVAERLELLRTEATVVTVAGTNGKGSCVATLEKLLIAQGQSVGAYTSPHILRYNERIRVAGEAATDADICAAFAAIDEARGDISLSYFEFGTLAALWLFRHFKLNYWLLEVGLGGRLDATNIIDADVAVVTSIALDHQQFLGDDRETIGREKAGVFRAGRPVVIADQQVPQSVVKQAAALECPVWLVGRAFDWQYSAETSEYVLTLTKGRTLLKDGALAKSEARESLCVPRPRLPLPSVAAALQVAAILGQLPEPHVAAEVVRNLHLQGRFQVVQYSGKSLYLDVAHNPAAAEHLARQLEASDLQDLGALVAIMADKDIRACLQPLLPRVRHWWLAGLPGVARAASPETVQEILCSLEVPKDRITLVNSVDGDLQTVLNRGLDSHGCHGLLITGSFFTVSAALQVCG